MYRPPERSEMENSSHYEEPATDNSYVLHMNYNMDFKHVLPPEHLHQQQLQPHHQQPFLPRRDSDGDRKFSKICDGKYFAVQSYSKEGDKLQATCALCSKCISGSLTSTGNFLSHIKRIHSEVFEECKEHIMKRSRMDYHMKSELLEYQQRSHMPEPEVTVKTEADVDGNFAFVNCYAKYDEYETNESLMSNENSKDYTDNKNTSDYDQPPVKLQPPPTETKPSTSRLNLTAIPDESDARFPKILDGTYFFINSYTKEDGKLSAACRLCGKCISGSVSSTGNFLSHIKRKHPTNFEICRVYLGKKRTSDYQLQQLQRQEELPNTVPVPSIKQAILNYIVDDLRPPPTIEKPAFINLCYTIAGRKVDIPSAESLNADIAVTYNKLKNLLKMKLSNRKYVCTTLDSWSCDGCTYMGVSVHYFEEYLTKHSYMLGFKEIQKSQNLNSIAEELLNEFDLNVHKITHTVADGGSSLAKAIPVYKDIIYEVKSEPIDEVFGMNVKIEPIENDFTPAQLQCSVLTYNLFGNDINEMLNENIAYSQEANGFKSMLAKFQTVWNKYNENEEIRLFIDNECRGEFPVLNDTHWNSLYTILNSIYQMKEKIFILFQKLRVDEITAIEWRHIFEYLMLMKPISVGLNILQTDKDVTLGYVLPTVLAVKSQIEQIVPLTVCNGLQKCILAAIQTRFGHILDFRHPKSKDFIIAAVSHPKFKLFWVPKEELFAIRTLFIGECEAMFEPVANDNLKMPKEDDFYSVLKQNSGIHENRNGNISMPDSTRFQLELMAYLDNRNENLYILLETKTIKNVFLKYNTTVPSAAIVDRLFSEGLQMLSAKRNVSEFQSFEQVLFVKANRQLLDRS